MFNKISFNFNLINLYMLMSELIDLNEFCYIKKVIVVGDWEKAFIINLRLKLKGITVLYIEEKKFLHYIKKVNMNSQEINNQTSFIIEGIYKKAIFEITNKNNLIKNYIFLPI